MRAARKDGQQSALPLEQSCPKCGLVFHTSYLGVGGGMKPPYRCSVCGTDVTAIIEGIIAKADAQTRQEMEIRGAAQIRREMLELTSRYESLASIRWACNVLEEHPESYIVRCYGCDKKWEVAKVEIGEELDAKYKFALRNAVRCSCGAEWDAITLYDLHHR